MRVGAIIAIGITLLAAACGGRPPSATSPATAHANASIAFARCMRTHGVPGFPDPDANGAFPSFSTGVSKQISSAANDACKHLLPGEGAGDSGAGGQQKKLAFALKVAQCVRKHGYPAFPDPSGAGGSRIAGTGIYIRSPRFQAAETGCEQQARKALGLP